jgi:hypothetical protein
MGSENARISGLISTEWGTETSPWFRVIRLMFHETQSPMMCLADQSPVSDGQREAAPGAVPETEREKENMTVKPLFSEMAKPDSALPASAARRFPQ